MLDPAAYQPSDAVLAALRKVDVIAIVGPSGAGKTTLVNRAVAQDPSLHVVISDVSRAMRPGEINGKHYFFRSKADMLAAIECREYVQYAPSNSGDIYASHVENYATEGYAVVTLWVDAVAPLRALPFRSFRTLYIVPESYEVWQQHLRSHEFEPELYRRRMAEVVRSIEFALHDARIEFVINDDLDTSTTRLLNTIHHPSTISRHEISTARSLLESILAKLKHELREKA